MSSRVAFPGPTPARGDRLMAQCDVFVNPSTSAGDSISYVVVQSDLLDALASRLTMPLAAFDFVEKVPTALCPVISVNGQRLHALAHCAAPLPAKLLRRSLTNVAVQASAVSACSSGSLPIPPCSVICPHISNQGANPRAGNRSRTGDDKTRCVGLGGAGAPPDGAA